jgi:hypothetical protein
MTMSEPIPPIRLEAERIQLVISLTPPPADESDEGRLAERASRAQRVLDGFRRRTASPPWRTRRPAA